MHYGQDKVRLSLCVFVGGRGDNYMVAPVGGPAIFDEPVVLAGLGAGAIPHQQHSVVQVLRLPHAIWLIQDP